MILKLNNNYENFPVCVCMSACVIGLYTFTKELYQIFKEYPVDCYPDYSIE